MINEIIQFIPVARPDLPAVFLGQDDEGLYVVRLIPHKGRDQTLFKCMSLKTALHSMSVHVEDAQVKYEVNG